MSNKGLLIILSAPAGTGKTTVVEALLKKNPKLLQSISYTTRKRRAAEMADVHYHFVSEEIFLQMCEQGEFLEEVALFGAHYGTSKKETLRHLSEGRHLILVIDTEGAKKVREKMDAVSIFLLPPSMEELRRRLEIRNTEGASAIEDRLKIAEKELNEREFYDYQVVNDHVESAALRIQEIIEHEESLRNII